MNSPNMIEKEFERRLKKNLKKYYCDELGLSNYEERIKSRLNEDLGRCLNEVRIIEQYTGTIKGKDVLCIGSGWGGITVAAGKIGARAVGIEPEKELIEISKLRASVRSVECNFILGKGERLPFKDGTFDVIECFTVLEHVENPRLVIEEMIRVLKCEGFCYIVVPNYLYPYEEHYKIYWIPMLPKRLAKFQLRLFGRNPDFIGNISYITPYFISRVLSNLDRKYGIEVKHVNIAKSAKSTQIARVSKTAMSCSRIIPKMISKICSLIGIICGLIGMDSHIEILIRKKGIKGQ